MKRFLALFLAAVLLGSVTSFADVSEPPVPDDDIFVLGETSDTGEWTVYDTAVNAETPLMLRSFVMLDGSSGLPSLHDPRGSGMLPSVRSQGGWNTCWAIAAIGAAEVGGLKQELLPYSADTVDLSERHLLYFLSHQADDPLGNSSGDYNTNPSLWMRTGGNPIFAMMTFASWHGAASEAETNSYYSGISASDYLSGSYAYTDVLHLENTYVLNVSGAEGRNALKRMLLTYGGAVGCFHYDSSYLFAGSPSAAAASAAEDPDEPTDPEPDPVPEPESSTSPEPEQIEQPELDSGFEEDQEPEPDSGSEEDREPEPAAEEADEDESLARSDPEQDNGEPASVPLVAFDGEEDDASVIEEDSTEEGADDFTVCYYQNEVATRTTHEILIVGWDDDYPAENFGYSAEGAVPPGNGAWLCRNSYGPNWYGGDGYFWLSYYDACLSYDTSTLSGRVTVFDFASSDNYDNNYEYDGAAVMSFVNDSVNGRGVSTLNANAGSSRWYANVFTACANSSPLGYETLRAVSTYSYRPNVGYTVEIYTDLADSCDPASGTLAAVETGTFTYPGFHTVALSDSVLLTEGESYSVVFTVSRSSDGSIFVPSCTTSSTWYSVNDADEGQSFVSVDGDEWYDCIDLSNAPNVRIKAYTDNDYFAGEYAVIYRANGGTGAPDPQVKEFGTTLTLTDSVPTRSGYIFLGWAESSTAAEAKYQPGDEFTQRRFVTLYAVWAPDISTLAAARLLRGGDPYDAALMLQYIVGRISD